MPLTPMPRWGVRFTANPDHDQEYLQNLYDNDDSSAKRGELFLNEPKAELYYVDSDGVCKTVNGSLPIPFNRIDFTGIRDFANDSEAAAATPPVPIGGMYLAGSVLRVRRA
jgi:hypothetical protein